jgi:hypothetical protein
VALVDLMQRCLRLLAKRCCDALPMGEGIATLNSQPVTSHLDNSQPHREWSKLIDRGVVPKGEAVETSFG